MSVGVRGLAVTKSLVARNAADRSSGPTNVSKFCDRARRHRRRRQPDAWSVALPGYSDRRQKVVSFGDPEAGRAAQASACARTRAWATAGGPIGITADGEWGFSLIKTAEPQKSPSKARTITARVALARRCLPRSPRSGKDGDLGFAKPRTRRLWASARPGIDAKRSKIGMCCLCPLFVPDGSAGSAWLALHKSGDPDGCIIRSGLPQNRAL